MKSWIYGICDEDKNIIYIGSTMNKYLSIRYAQHKSPSEQLKSTRLQTYIKNNGGWDKFDFKIIEECQDISKQELRFKEKQYINEYLPHCNQITPCQTKEEYLQYYRIVQKQWRKENPEKVREKNIKYKQKVNETYQSSTSE